MADEKAAFTEWFHSTYKVAVWFDGDKLSIPPRSGKSVPAIAHVAWAAWNKRAILANSTAI
jgi:hypothetical protein